MKVTACLYCGSNDLTYITHRLDNNGILRCGKCTLMMVENLSDDTEQLYTADYFEKEKGTKNGYSNYLSSPVANLIGKYGFTRLFASKAGNHLDLGCADGSLMEIFKSEGFASRGLEISRDAVEIAKGKGLDVSFSRLAPFPAGLIKSDVITAFDLLEHVDKPGAVLKEIYANLADGGHFVFSTLSVKKNDPSDYWYNNSLEHYIYYNRENLEYVLTDTFGKGQYGFVEMEINGIAEFWGFAKKGKVADEQSIIKLIESGKFDHKNATNGYLMSLFYDQVSQFALSEDIIKHFSSVWPQSNLIQAKFYNYYYQGMFEKAVEDSQHNRHLLPAANSIYWQALNNAEEVLSRIRKQDVEREHNAEILDLRSQIFTLRDEMQALRNSRVVGRVIKAREKVGSARHKLAPLPKRAIHKTRVIVAPAVPAPLRRSSKKAYRAVRHGRTKSSVKVAVSVVDNAIWPVDVPILSVVIPYYNRADTIDDTLNSLQLQTFTNFEVLLVNDGSTDKASIEKLEVLRKSNPDIRYIDQENQGVAAARNNGIKQAKGKYIICLDSDDMIDETYIEKVVTVLETSPDVSIVTSWMDIFGVNEERFMHDKYDAAQLYKNNMVTTAAAFRKQAWEDSGGYKSGIGYEDWDFWLTLGEHGFWAKQIPEALFRYRRAMQSRYVEDKDVHWSNVKNIRALHPGYKAAVRRFLSERQRKKQVVNPETAFINTNNTSNFLQTDNGKPNVLITVSWMTFGGAETLIYNYCREIKDDFNLTYISGLPSENEWEYKFKEITSNIYHLTNLFEQDELRLEFVANYIKTRRIDLLHIVHNDFVFKMLPELKKRFPELKVAVTMFNDRAEHFQHSIDYKQYIDNFVSDNEKVIQHYQKQIGPEAPVAVVPNGINCYEEFNLELFNRSKQRAELDIADDELAVFFVGRLSEEKNPDVFFDVAEKLATNKRLKFFMIGDGPMRGEIEDSIKKGAGNIRYLGYQSEIARYLSTADIFVLPSAIEGFPLSILEAMAMKVAVIASDVGAVAEVVDSGKDGIVVKPGSATEIADAVTKLAADSKFLSAVKRSARQKVEDKYSNRILGVNYRKLYKGLIK